MRDSAKLNLLFSISVFGTIGIFVKYIDAPSSFISLTRGIIGALFIFFFAYFSKRTINWESIRKNLTLLIITGIVMGFNWILLFESYRYTTVAVATVCYYFQPIFLIILSPLVLGEKMDAKKSICVAIAFVGMFFISGLAVSTEKNMNPTGVFLGTSAGLLYALVVLLNKKLKEIDSSDSTMIQLLSAGLIMIPYCMITGDLNAISLDTTSLILLAIVCFGHTGFAYVLYFRAVHRLPAQTVAIFGYIDPILSIILSALLLKETFGMNEFIGTVLILGATFVSSIGFPRKKNA